jgi:hypothetical protein
MPPLRVHPTNPCWLAHHDGRAVFLTGSHHWDVLVDNGERPGVFDFTDYLDKLTAWGHSCVRMWVHEAWVHDLSHSPWARTGPGLAADGRPRYDLERFDGEYFARLRERVARAGERGLFVVVMLFNGWSLRDNGDGNPWPRHPFHPDNNRNGIDGDPDDRGDGDDVHSLRLPAIAALQRLYVERVVEAVGDLDCVLWEISNESPGGSRDWQRHLLRHLRACDAAHGAAAGRPAHPVGLTSCFPGGDNRDLFSSPADWASPNRRGGWMGTPPANDGEKVVLLDSDHLWGIGGDATWIWRAFLSGHQPLYMDPLDEHGERAAARKAMGVARRLVDRLPAVVGTGLETLAPRPELASSGCCLASIGERCEALVAWAPRGRLRLDLRAAPVAFAGEWVHPVTGAAAPAAVAGGSAVRAAAPWKGDAALVLRAVSNAPASTPRAGEDESEPEPARA